MPWATKSVQITPTPSGVIDSDYPDGDDGTALAWATLPNFQAVEGQAATFSVRADYLSGTGATTATITSESALPSGWSISGGNLVYSGTGVGTVNTRLIANGAAYSNSVAVAAVVAPTASDALAPPPPTRLVATGGTNEVLLEWDQTGDNHDGTRAASLIQKYEVYCAGVKVADVTGLPGLASSAALTQQTIGTLSPAATSAQSGNGWEIVSEGFISEGSKNGPDRFRRVFRTLSGDACVTVRIASVADVATAYAKVGVMARAGNGVQAAFCAAMLRTTNNDAAMEHRASDGGTRVSSGATTAGTLSAPCWVKLRRVGDVFESYYAPDSSGVPGTWVLSSSQTIPMIADLDWGIFACSSVDTSPITATFTDLAFAGATRASYTHPTATGGAYKIKAVDEASNASGFSEIVTQAPAVVANLKPWNPGHWVQARTALRNNQAAMEALFDEIAGTNFKGIFVHFNWVDLEGDVQGTYNWSKPAAYLAKAASVGKKFAFSLKAAEADTIETAAPAYVRNIGGTNAAVFLGGGGYAITHWRPAVMDAMITMFQAIAAEFDGHPALDFLTIVETAIGASRTYLNSTDDYTASGFSAQLLRLIESMRAVMPRTNIRVNGNNFTSSAGANILALAAQFVAATQDCMHGGPDIRVQPPATGQEGKTPVHWDRVLWGEAGSAGGVDYREGTGLGTVAITQHQQLWGNTYYTPQQTAEYFSSALHGHYLFWMNTTLAASYPGDWQAIKDYVAANPTLTYNGPPVNNGNVYDA